MFFILENVFHCWKCWHTRLKLKSVITKMLLRYFFLFCWNESLYPLIIFSSWKSIISIKAILSAPLFCSMSYFTRRRKRIKYDSTKKNLFFLHLVVISSAQTTVSVEAGDSCSACRTTSSERPTGTPGWRWCRWSGSGLSWSSRATERRRRGCGWTRGLWRWPSRSPRWRREASRRWRPRSRWPRSWRLSSPAWLPRKRVSFCSAFLRWIGPVLKNTMKWLINL